jgi:hypothetical protein
VAFFSGNGTACRTAQARAEGCASVAAKLLTKNTTQGAAQTTADRRLGAACGHSALGKQGAQGQDGKCFTHVANLEKNWALIVAVCLWLSKSS